VKHNGKERRREEKKEVKTWRDFESS